VPKLCDMVPKILGMVPKLCPWLCQGLLIIHVIILTF
jgi:hypothetical protein